MSRPSASTYKTRNSLSYNEALKRRGALTICFDPGRLCVAKIYNSHLS